MKIKNYFEKDKNIFKYTGKLIKYVFKKKPDLLMAPGAHIITGYPGAGKTLLMSEIINRVDSDKYFFLSNIPEFLGHNNVFTFDIECIFSDYKMVRTFPITDYKGRQLYGVIFDEINLNFNKRLNRKSDYNALFIGLIEFLVTHRHQGVKRVYFIGQKLELQDTQLQSLFKYQHDIIKSYKRPFYWYYYDKNKIAFLPKKLKVIHFLKDDSDAFNAFKIKNYKIHKASIKRYDTHALRLNYCDLPTYTITTRQKN